MMWDVLSYMGNCRHKQIVGPVVNIARFVEHILWQKYEILKGASKPIFKRVFVDRIITSLYLSSGHLQVLILIPFYGLIYPCAIRWIKAGRSRR